MKTRKLLGVKLSPADRGLIGLIIVGLIILIILIAGCFHKSDQAIRTVMVPEFVYVDREGPTVTQTQTVTVTNNVTKYLTITNTATLTETVEVPVTTTVTRYEAFPVPGPIVTKTTALPGITTTVIQPTTTTITITKTVPAPTTTHPRCDH
jgi:hypothetical protein